MKLINQSFQIVNQKGFTLKDIYKHIEYCARISYKSQDKITDNSYEKFVSMLINRKHDRPLEFGTVHLKCDWSELDAIQNLVPINTQWLKYSVIENEDNDEIYITTNYRYYLDLCKRIAWLPEILDESDSEYYPKRYTIHMILDRGVMDEFRTHVGLSHLAESTRYCNYSKDKFDNEVTFIQPCWDIRGSNWIDYLRIAEEAYFRMLKEGWTPQQARSVLPLSVKSELISCGFGDAWSNFFFRRDAKDAHPMAQEIAKPMHEEYLKLIKC